MKIRTKILGVIGLAALLVVVAGVTNNPAGAEGTRATTEIGAYGMVSITLK